MQSIQATYQQGVFRPLCPVALPEGSKVELRIELTPTTASSHVQEKLPQRAALPIEEQFAQLAAQVPQSEWGSLPADLSENLDFHLYGTNRE